MAEDEDDEDDELPCVDTVPLVRRGLCKKHFTAGQTRAVECELRRTPGEKSHVEARAHSVRHGPKTFLRDTMGQTKKLWKFIDNSCVKTGTFFGGKCMKIALHWKNFSTFT